MGNNTKLHFLVVLGMSFFKGMKKNTQLDCSGFRRCFAASTLVQYCVTWVPFHAVDYQPVLCLLHHYFFFLTVASLPLHVKRSKSMCWCKGCSQGSKPNRRMRARFWRYTTLPPPQSKTSCSVQDRLTVAYEDA